MDKERKMTIGEWALVGLFAVGAGSFLYYPLRGQSAAISLEKARIEKGYIYREQDLNNNGVPEKFYEIDGRKYFLEIDGQRLEDKLKN